ncbi:MAG: OFA family MFS transporter [Eubacteriales bacterium]|nr:OFA family MFS transporter [Eubacteriales bacterium]
MWQIKNRYVVLIGALLAQVTIAGLYAWSIFGTALQQQKGFSNHEILMPYAIAQFVFALSTLISGRLVDKKGPRPAILIGGLLYGSGLIISSLVTTPNLLYVTYGVLVGAGVGFVYVCPLSTLIKWFPKKRGMITGLSVGVFGGGSIIFQRVISALLETSSVTQSFLKLGILSMTLILIGGLLTNNPPSYGKAVVQKTSRDYTTKEMIGTSKFKLTWIMYWLAVIPGLLVLGAAKNIGLEVANLDAAAATGVISILALSNASSRLISGSLSDRFGTLRVLKGIFAITIISLLSLSFAGSIKLFFYLGVIGVAVGYGGFLSLFPTFTNQEFGTYRYASNYGVIYQAYGLAALSGIFLKAAVGSFSNTFLFSAFTATIGLIISFFIKERSTEEQTLAKTS